MSLFYRQIRPCFNPQVFEKGSASFTESRTIASVEYLVAGFKDNAILLSSSAAECNSQLARVFDSTEQGLFDR